MWILSLESVGRRLVPMAIFLMDTSKVSLGVNPAPGRPPACFAFFTALAIARLAEER